MFMRQVPTEKQISCLVKNYIIQLPNKTQDFCQIGERFEKAYFQFIDSQKLPTLSTKFLQQIEKITFCQILLDHVDKESLNELNGIDVYQMINHYYQYQPTHGGIILNKERTKFLIVRSAHSKKYGFPKGKAQQNQSMIKCALRQIKEEVGIKVKLNEEEFVNVKDAGRGSCLFFVTQVEDNEILRKKGKKDNEIMSIMWLTAEEVESISGEMNFLSRIAWKLFKKKYMKKERKMVEHKEKSMMINNEKKVEEERRSHSQTKGKRSRNRNQRRKNVAQC